MENTPQTKICKICKIEQPINKYSKAKANKDGYQGKCRDCTNITRDIYRKTKKGTTGEIYSNQRHNARLRNYELPTYTKAWLEKWLMNQDLYHTLYETWKNNGYKTDLKPSVDRIDDYKSYAEDNIQLTTFKQNRDRYFSDAQKGINRKQCISVVKCDMKGNTIEEFFSMSDAYRKTGIHFKYISRVCNGERKSTGGFKWKYK